MQFFVVVGRGLPDARHFFQKNLLYRLLCSFVTFVFQKSALRGFRDVFRDIVGRGRPDVQCLCLVSDVLCLKSCV